MINFQAFLHRLRLVILTDHQLAAALIAHFPFGGRFEINVVAGAAAFANPPSRQALLNGLIRHLNVQDLMDHNAHSVERLRLRNRSGKAIQDKTVFAILLRQPFFDNGDYDFIWDKGAGIHVRLGFLPQFGAVFQCLADNVAGADGRNLQFFANHLGLPALSCARCS